MGLSIKVGFKEDGTLSDVVLDGLTGSEKADGLKDAVGMLAVSNPILELAKAIRAGEYGPDPDSSEEFRRMSSFVFSIKDLWQFQEYITYPGYYGGKQSMEEMNVMVLLANAFVKLYEQYVELTGYKEAIMDDADHDRGLFAGDGRFGAGGTDGGSEWDGADDGGGCSD